jgi:cytochrome c553
MARSRAVAARVADPIAEPDAMRMLASVVLLVAATGSAAGADVAAGRAKAQMCQACHGLDGLSKVPDAPNIAGQTEAYVATQLQAFRSGARKSEAMSVVAATLSDSDIANLAAYYAAIEIKVLKIPGE